MKYKWFPRFLFKEIWKSFLFKMLNFIDNKICNKLLNMIHIQCDIWKIIKNKSIGSGKLKDKEKEQLHCYIG